jgi:hypothetical protein
MFNKKSNRRVPEHGGRMTADEQRAYRRRLQKLQARDRRWNHEASWRTHSRRLEKLQEHHALDDDLRPTPGRRNREIDDGGLD